MPPIRIAMWSGPRNISTAMMRSWENRPDTAVVDRPPPGRSGPGTTGRSALSESPLRIRPNNRASNGIMDVMDHGQEIVFTFEDGVLRPDGTVNLPNGARGIATLRQLVVRANGLTRAESLAAIRRIGESGVFDSGSRKLSRDQMHERD